MHIYIDRSREMKKAIRDKKHQAGANCILELQTWKTRERHHDLLLATEATSG
jgi:hypothetical protein